MLVLLLSLLYVIIIAVKNIFKIFKSDVKRIFKNKIALGITIGVIVIPGIYAWLNIDSNWEPYSNTGNIPIAVVNKDKGTTILGENVNMGDEIEKALRENNDMKWIFTDEQNAKENVEKSDYYGAVIIPENFSNDFATIISDSDLKHPTFNFYINNKKNPIAPIIVGKAVSAVQDSVNQTFVNTIAYNAVSAAESFDVATKGAVTTDNIINKLTEAKSRIGQLRTVLSTTGAAADATSKSLSALRSTIPVLKSTATGTAQDLGNLKDTVKSFNDTYSNIEQDLATALNDSEKIIKDLLTVIDPSNPLAQQLSEQLVKIENAKGRLATTKADLDNLYQRSSRTIDNATNTLLNLNSSLDSVDLSMRYMIDALTSGKQLTQNLDTVLNDFQSDTDKIIATVREAAKSEIYRSLINLLRNNPSDVADFLSTPVEANRIEIYPVDSYGSTMAPFYSVLACWVGCTILIALFKVDVKTAPKGAKNYQKFFGRFIIVGLVAISQGLIIGIGDLLLHVQVINIPLFLLTLMLSSAVFMLIIYALTAVFGKIGQALSIVLLVIQAAGSGGTYPIELLPRFFQILQPYMPFYPSMNATRETIAGFYQTDYVFYLLLLLCHIIVPLFLGLVVSRYTVDIKQKVQRGLHATDVIG